MKFKFAPKLYNHTQRSSHLIAVVSGKRGDTLIERYADMPEGEWAEIAVNRIQRAKRKRAGNA